MHTDTLFSFLPEAAWKSSKSQSAAWVETLWGRKKKGLDKGKGKERKVMSLSRVQLCDPMGYSLPGSSVCGIFQARVLEWIAISFSKTTARDSQTPQDWNASRPLSPSNLLTFHSTWLLIFFFISLSLEHSPLFYTSILKPLGFTGGWMGKEPDCQWQATQETWVQSLGWEDPLEEKMATHSSMLAWRIPWTEEPGELQLIGSQRVGHNWVSENTHVCFLAHPRKRRTRNNSHHQCKSA